MYRRRILCALYKTLNNLGILFPSFLASTQGKAPYRKSTKSTEVMLRLSLQSLGLVRLFIGASISLFLFFSANSNLKCFKIISACSESSNYNFLP
jgi:hypothetical protein